MDVFPPSGRSSQLPASRINADATAIKAIVSYLISYCVSKCQNKSVSLPIGPVIVSPHAVAVIEIQLVNLSDGNFCGGVVIFSLQFLSFWNCIQNSVQEVSVVNELFLLACFLSPFLFPGGSRPTSCHNRRREARTYRVHLLRGLLPVRGCSQDGHFLEQRHERWGLRPRKQGQPESLTDPAQWTMCRQNSTNPRHLQQLRFPLHVPCILP